MTGTDERRQRLYESFMDTLMEGEGYTLDEAEDAYDALLAANEHEGYCVLCGYKRKGATGTGAEGEELSEIVELELIAQNPQRDGDAGDLDLRKKHNLQVLHALYYAPTGSYTDEELHAASGILSPDSAKGARAGLRDGLWVRAVVVNGKIDKRRSRHDRPMALWELTPAGRRKLREIIGESERGQGS